MSIEAEIKQKFNQQNVSLEEIMGYLLGRNKDTNRKTTIWMLNEMVKKGSISRIGRGFYDFSEVRKRQEHFPVRADVRKVIELIQQNFRYVDIVVSDSRFLGEYTVQQPFVTITKIEVNPSAVEAVTAFLRKQGVDAFSYCNIDEMDKYATSFRVFVIDKIRYNNPIKKQNGIRVATWEKVMVDLVCDEKVYKQYQGEELENIYNNIIEKNGINFSTILKYASGRNKKEQVIKILQNNKKFNDFWAVYHDKR